MRSLVTGGGGFIGGHLVRMLHERGEQVRVLDVDVSRVPDGVEAVTGSVTDAGAVGRAMQDVTAVFHLAAYAHLWARDPSIYDRVNVDGAANVLDAAKRVGVEKLVHVSSATALVGRARKISPGFITEESAVNASDLLGPYPLSKWRSEQMALAAAGGGLSVSIVTPTVPIGPGDYGLTAPTVMIRDYVDGKTPAYLDTVINLIDVRDAAAACIAARDFGRSATRYIVGGENLEMTELLDKLEAVTGARMPGLRAPYWLACTAAAIEEWLAKRVTGRPPKAPLTGVRIAGRRVLYDNTRAKVELGLAPRPVEDSFADAVRWLIEEGHIRRRVPAFAEDALA